MGATARSPYHADLGAGGELLERPHHHLLEPLGVLRAVGAHRPKHQVVRTLAAEGCDARVRANTYAVDVAVQNSRSSVTALTKAARSGPGIANFACN